MKVSTIYIFGAVIFFISSAFSNVLKVPSEYSTIQSAVDSAEKTSDIVLVADGIYRGIGNTDVSLRGKAITVMSENGPENCIIDCNGKLFTDNRGFYICEGEDSNSVIDGFTIQYGWGRMWDTPNNQFGGGGGIRIIDSSPTIKNCLFFRNRGGKGGAIYCKRSNSKITNCSFIDNFGDRGSGIYCDNSIKWHPGPVNGGPTISNCLFTKNKASLTNFFRAGTIFCGNSTMIINNCTLTDNNYGIFIVEGEVLIDSCIIYGNENYEIATPNWYTPFISIAYSDFDWWKMVVGDKSSLLFIEGNICADPCFVDSANKDYRLRFDSTCIDAGDPHYFAEPNETDLDGNPRIQGGRIDMGVYEHLYIESYMKITPTNLNPESKGKWVKAHFILPQEYIIDDVDVNKPAEIWPFGIKSDSVDTFINDEDLVEIVASFGRREICNHISGEQILSLMCVVFGTNGEYFYGIDDVVIKNKHFEELAKFALYWLSTDCKKPDWCDGLDVNNDCKVDFVDFAMLADNCLVGTE